MPLNQYKNQCSTTCIIKLENIIFVSDQCLIHGTNHYRRDGGCNCFYKCVEGISVPSCCPKGYRYDDDKECVRASGRDLCDDECETPSILTRQLAQTCKWIIITSIILSILEGDMRNKIYS